MKTEHLIETNELHEGKLVFKTGMAFNARNANSLTRMLAIVSIAERYGVEVGQEVGTGVDDGGMISYMFAVPEEVIPNYWEEKNRTIDLLNLDKTPELPTDDFIKEMDNLYNAFSLQLLR